MDCREIKEQASAYYHREVEEMFQRAISEHLHLCPSCQQEYQELRTLLEEIQAASHPKIPLSPDYFERLVEKIKGDPDLSPVLVENILVENPLFENPSYSKFFTIRTVAVLLSLAALLLLGIFLNPFGSRTKAPSLLKSPSRLSETLSFKSKFSKSKTEYMRHLALIDPEDPQGNVQLARWCKEKNLFSEAREHLQRALFLEPQNPEAKALKKEFKM